MHNMIRSTAASLLGGAAVFCAVGCSGVAEEQPVADAQPMCECELKSWRVFARGRHLLVDIESPEGYEHMSGRVEFTKVSLRSDYTGSPLGGTRFARAPLGRMTRDAVLTPIMMGGDQSALSQAADRGPSGAVERLEMTFSITVEQAEQLQRDRVWNTTYKLFGPNSNSGIRVALEEIGVELPTHVLQSGGALGEFPGVLSEVDEELPVEEWGRYGITENR